MSAAPPFSWTARLLLTASRFCLSAWVGAAALFVVNGVRLATAAEFDATARNHFAAIRFPPYYLFGFVLVGAATACLLAARRGLPVARGRVLVAAALSALSGVVMIGDYLLVYLPLLQMITPATSARPAEFVALHHTSELVNIAHVGLAFAAALLVSWPVRAEGGAALNAGG
jgi:hypothetical protein